MKRLALLLSLAMTLGFAGCVETDCDTPRPCCAKAPKDLPMAEPGPGCYDNCGHGRGRCVGPKCTCGTCTCGECCGCPGCAL